MSTRLPLLLFLIVVAGLLSWFAAAPAPGPAAPAPLVGPSSPEEEEGTGPLGLLAPHLRGLAAEARDEDALSREAQRAVEGVLAEAAARDGRWEPGGAALRAGVGAALASPDWSLRWAGALAVPRIGPLPRPLVEALARSLDPSEDDRVAEAAARALAFAGEGYAEHALPALLRAGREGPARVRLAALETLARRPAAPVADDPGLFLAALEASEAPLRRAGAQALAAVALAERLPEGLHAEVAARLRTALGDRSPDVRMYAAMALGRLGPAAAGAQETLVEALGDPSPLVRDHAAAALAAIGPGAVPALEAALVDPAVGRLPSVAWALRLAGEPGLAALERALAGSRADVRLAAALALVEARRATPAAVAVLERALGSAEADDRLLAARGLGRAGPAAQGARPALVALRDDPDAGVRAAVEGALRQLSQAGED